MLLIFKQLTHVKWKLDKAFSRKNFTVAPYGSLKFLIFGKVNFRHQVFGTF